MSPGRPQPCPARSRPSDRRRVESVGSETWERRFRSWVAPDPATSPASWGECRAYVRGHRFVESQVWSRAACGRRPGSEVRRAAVFESRARRADRAVRVDTVITGKQLRAVLGNGGQVVDSVAQHVGRIVDVVLNPQSYEPAWVIVACERGPVVVVPLAAARRLDGCLQLPYAVADVRRAPDTEELVGRLTPERAEELAGYFHSPDGHAHRSNGHRASGGHAPGRPRRQAFSEAPAGTAPAPFPGTPASSTDGHRRTTAAPPELVPILRGLGMRTGRDAPVAYPGSAPRPWPLLVTSSPGPPWWERRQWRWPSAVSSVRTMRLELRALLDTTGLPADDLDDLTLAACEAAANAVEHARSSDQRYFDVLTEVGEDWAGIVVQDHGRWRAPSGESDRGRGLRLMDVLADTVLSVGARGTTVVLRNRLARSG